jgi:tripartite-type tricarboxylate transporter receptor subunit TctC
MILRMVLALAALAVTAPEMACAQEWPTRPVRVMVPFPAGGSTDVGARVIAEYLTRVFGQQVYVENKSGAPPRARRTATRSSSPPMP